MMHSKRALDAMRHYFSIIWSDLSLHGELRGPKKLGHDWARECHDIHGYTTEELQEAIFVLDPLLTSTLKEGLYAGWPFGEIWRR